VDLPPPETPVTQVKTAERDFGGDVLQVVAGRADDADHLLLVGPAPFRRDGDLLPRRTDTCR
jgi:hypothetical protein